MSERIVDVDAVVARYAKTFGWNKCRVWKLAREGTMPRGVVVRIGRQYWFNLEKLDAWLESGGTANGEVRAAK